MHEWIFSQDLANYPVGYTSYIETFKLTSTHTHTHTHTHTTTILVQPFANLGLWAWLWGTSSPHSWEPLREGLSDEGDVAMDNWGSTLAFLPFYGGVKISSVPNVTYVDKIFC